MTNSGSGRGAVLAWSLYDFGNSAFTTLVVTFVYSSWFTHSLAPDVLSGTAMWSRGVALTAIIVALLSPVLGALADRHACRKMLLAATTILCVVSTAALYLPTAGQIGAALILFVLANIGFELGTVFYNAFLPGITSDHGSGLFGIENTLDILVKISTKSGNGTKIGSFGYNFGTGGTTWSD
ncbi:MAG TPA: hypothetical protein EYQ31_15880, partial [Candidatus Handelsmanbacteria bacterium]|nr:hypothetical protein [Candidatus Handelsmanbacteria bacterium]